MSNNADLGITLQKIICDKYSLKLHQNAIKQFAANYNEEYKNTLAPIINKIFNEINLFPIKCLTYAPSSNSKEKFSPHNFLLSNGKTLSFRTNKSNDKVAPRVIGQCGINTFNSFFSDIAEYKIDNKKQIKNIIFENIEKMIPVFLDYLFVSDYTVWLYENHTGNFDFEIFDRNNIVDISTDRDSYSFTKTPDSWNESTTLKYNGVSLAEIQIHKNRTFKFRFIMKSLRSFIKFQNITTETLGITAEKTICDLFNIEVPENYTGRYSLTLQNELTPIVLNAFRYLPNAIKSTGSEKGERGKNSKCSYDFILEGKKTLSLKTNTGKMICPPEVGQPGTSTCYLYFGHLTDADGINDSIFKEMVLKNVDKMLPIYLNHLFDSDYLLWIFKKKGQYNYKIFKSGFANHMKWNRNNISFTKNSIEEWNESNTVKYKGISIGEFQVHKARSCYKFRFNMENLEKIVLEE